MGTKGTGIKGKVKGYAKADITTNTPNDDNSHIEPDESPIESYGSPIATYGEGGDGHVAGTSRAERPGAEGSAAGGRCGVH